MTGGKKALGATKLDWQRLVEAGLANDLLPVVCDPDVPISPTSTLTSLGKTPSAVDARGRAHGIKDWTTKFSTEDEIQHWASDGRLGICLQTRLCKVFDVDVEDHALANRVEDVLRPMIAEFAGVDPSKIPLRFRDNSSKFAILVRCDAVIKKRNIQLGELNKIEFLGNGQQAVIAGTHPSGSRIRWEGDITNAPSLTADQIETVWQRLEAEFRLAPARLSAPVVSQPHPLVEAQLPSLAAALAVIPADDRELWVRMGHALKTLGEAAKPLWHKWSARSVKYDRADAERVWLSFKPDRTGSEAIFAEARSQGWSEPVSALVANAEGIVAHPYHPRDPATIPPRRWIIDRLLLGGTVTVLTAPGGSGKTTFTIGLALSIATGRPILGMTVCEPWNVWVWNLEDDLDELERSIGAARQHHSIEDAEIVGKLSVNSALDGSELCTATEGRDGMTLLEPVFDKISAEIKAKDIRVLIIDPFVSSHAVEENSNTKIDKIAKAWARVARATGCAIILVHHTSKAGAGEVSSASARGASALTSAARGVLVINKMSADAARAVGVPDSDRWRYFSVQDDKHSRAPAEDARWFEIVPVGLANGDSVGVASPWEVPPDVPLYSAEDVRAVQALAASQTFRRHFRAVDWIGHAIGGEIGLDSYDPANRGRLDRIAREWIRLRYFVIEKRKDSGRKERDYLVPGAAPTSIKDAIGLECGS